MPEEFVCICSFDHAGDRMDNTSGEVLFSAQRDNRAGRNADRVSSLS